MSKLLTVVGATGTQGQSVIESALKDKSYSIRAITRNPSSEKAKLLASKGIEVVKADLNDEQSLVEAFKVSPSKWMGRTYSNSRLSRTHMQSLQ
jgi:uncharacterized protein YbjT (DUF2867 family)